MKTKLLVLSSLIFAGLFLASPVFSQQERKLNNEMHKDCIMDDLSPEQTTKIDAIKTESDKKLVQYRADIKIKKAELEKMQIAENPSQKDINAKIDEIGKIKTDMEKEKVNRHLLIRQELTPEQRVKFDQMHARKDNMHNHSANCNQQKHDCKSSINHQGCKDGMHNNHGEGPMYKNR